MAKPRTIGLKKILVTVPVAGSAVPISATQLFVSDYEIYVKSSNVGTNIYVGDKTVDNTWIPRAKGSNWNFVHGTGNFIGRDAVVSFDLAKIYIDADIGGDEVIVQFYAGER